MNHLFDWNICTKKQRNFEMKENFANKPFALAIV
jgi:hypothetical protein